MMMRFNFRSVGAVALLGLAACGDPLSIPNYGSPDVSRVLFDAASVDAAIAGLGPQLNPQRACNLSTQAKILAEESFASVANFGMAARSANRSLVSNEVGNDLAASNASDFQAFQRVQRLAFNPLVAFASIKAANRNTLTANQENRMRAFAYLVAGQALGYAAFIYDSVAVAGEGITTDVVPGLSHYPAAGLHQRGHAHAGAVRRARPRLPCPCPGRHRADADGACRGELDQRRRRRAGVLCGLHR
jgi:hypothetical protein